MKTQTINNSIQKYKDELLNHSLYNEIKTIDDLHCFLENHVFAVWDFMSLLKALQSKLTCTTTPWIPVGNPETRYLINEIVLAEETDIDLDGHRKSHYELYLDAMKACGANTTPIENFLLDVVETRNIFVSIKQSELHPNVKEFLDFTFRVIEEGEAHQIAAAFTFGREDLIPDMFTRLLEKLVAESPEKVSIFKYYIERHIEVDGGHHSHLALEMVSELCGEDAAKWKEASEASIEALQIRAKLWNAVTA